MNLITVNQEYLDCQTKIWQSKFTWRGEDGRGFYQNFSIHKFIKETQEGMSFLKSVAKCKTLASFFNLADMISKDYYSFCIKQSGFPISNACEQSLRNHFKGMIGELFYTIFLQTHPVIQIDNKVLTFADVTPSFEAKDLHACYHDTGIDAFCHYRSGYDDQVHTAVIQYKFHNEFDYLKLDVFQKAHSDGAIYDIINPCDKKTVVILWSGKEDTISLEYNKSPRDKYVDVINASVIEKYINKDITFWGSFVSFCLQILD